MIAHMLTMMLNEQHHIIDNMTLEELDNALKKLGLDIESDAGKNTRNDILGLYGRSILNSKKERCLHCWMKETNQCGKFPCEYIGIPDDEVDVAVNYLSNRNDVNLFSFICMFVIPVYERTTGNENVMGKIEEAYRKQWLKEFGQQDRKY